MAITLADFNKIWASTSPLTPYSFSEANYKQGWNFIGSTPPARQMWDYLQKNNDEKMQYLANNYLPLTGGTMSGAITRSGGAIVANTSNNASALFLNAFSDGTNGAQLGLYGKDHVGAGRFSLNAMDGNTIKSLNGFPDGTLTWGGEPIPVIGNNAGGHNSVYRGKNLGTSVTADQYAEISAGTFRDMYIGDYWVINGILCRIAAFNYWLNCGDTNTTAHHVVIVPDSNLASCKMNDTNITTGAYIGSDYYTGNNSNTGKATAQTAINNAFGAAHILTHRELLANAVNSSGQASGWAWYDSTFELMNEAMVYGHGAWGSHQGYETGIDKGQLPLFALEPSRITNRANWWLRSVVSAAAFAVVSNYGHAGSYGASDSVGVRPAFAIKA